MKQAMLSGILLLSAMLVVSCGESPQKKIVGVWYPVGGNEGETVTFNSDGTVMSWEGRAEWQLSDEEPLVLSILEDGSLEAEYLVTFISDDEMEFELKGYQGEKQTLKRKSSE
jgi:hypothetical protein